MVDKYLLNILGFSTKSLHLCVGCNISVPGGLLLARQRQNCYRYILLIVSVECPNSRGVMGLNLVLLDKVFFSVDSGSLGHT